MNRLACFILMLLIPAIAASQDFTFYDSTNGLPSNDARCLAEDSLGNLWVGTGEGAAMYDGKDWTVYDTTNGLPYNVVHTIMADRNNNIWFGTFLHGVTVFNGTTFTTYDSSDGLLDCQEFNCMTVDSANRVWIGGVNGISVFNEGSWTMYDTGDGLEGIVRTIIFDGAGTPWAGTSRGIYRMYSDMSWGQPAGYTSDDIYDMFFDDPDIIWYGTYYKLTKFSEDGNLQCQDNKLVGTGAVNITFVQTGNVWFKKSGLFYNGKPHVYPGLTKFDGTDWFTYDVNNGMPVDRISTFMITRDGTIWVGTQNKGIFIFEEYPVPLSVVRPEASNIQRVGDTLKVTWLADTTLVDSVNIWISVDTAQTWTRINQYPVACTKSTLRNELGRLCRYRFVIPDSLQYTAGDMVSTVSNQCNIRIVNAYDDSMYAVSDERFIIRPAPLPAYLNIRKSPPLQYVHTNESVKLWLEVYNQYDNRIYQPFESVWSVSDSQDISMDGLFTAGPQEGGPYTVTVATTLHGVTLRDSTSVIVKDFLDILNPLTDTTFWVGDTVRVSWAADTSFVKNVAIILFCNRVINDTFQTPMEGYLTGSPLSVETAGLDWVIPDAFPGYPWLTWDMTDNQFQIGILTPHWEVLVKSPVFHIESTVEQQSDLGLVMKGAIEGLDIFPLPVTGTAVIDAGVPGALSVTIFNSTGKMVNHLEGDRRIVWNADDQTGKQVRSGIYYYKAVSGQSKYYGTVMVLE